MTRIGQSLDNTIPNDSLKHLSSEARAAYFDYHKYIKTTRGTIQTPLRFHDQGQKTLIWYNVKEAPGPWLYYFENVKETLDIVGRDIERVRRDSEGLEAPKKLEYWTHELELLPSDNNFKMEYHRFPQASITFRKVFSAKNKSDFSSSDLKFDFEAGVSEYSKNRLRSHIEGIVIDLFKRDVFNVTDRSPFRKYTDSKG